MTDRLFVGVTAWNSALLLGACLESLRRTAGSSLGDLVLFDNRSEDDSPAIARAHGATVLSGRMPQADAMNRLVARSRETWTLLLHADVVVLGEDWVERCARRIREGAALVSPEDIGCGMTRTFGAGKPESSFLFFETRALRRLREARWSRRRGVPWPRLAVDFHGPHVTHRLPEALASRGLRWAAMQVHPSDTLPEPTYRAPPTAVDWRPHLARFRYGLGNFYSLDGGITHYHNWYDRIAKDVAPDSTETSEPDGRGAPLAFVRQYTERFLSDWRAGTVRVPDLSRASVAPR